MTMISKKTLTNTIIIHKHPLVQQYTQQLVINFPQFQSIMLSMMHAPDLNSQMQCGVIRQEIA